EGGPHRRIPVSCLTKNMDIIDTTQPAITARWRVEREIRVGRSFDDPTAGGKVGLNCAVRMPGRICAPPQLLVHAKDRSRNKWRDGVVAYHVPPPMTGRRDLTN